MRLGLLLDVTGPQVPEGLAQWLFDQAYKKVGLNGRSRLWDAWKIVRFWERVAPFLDDDTIRLAEAAADVAEVLPDGWSAPAVSREPWSLTYQEVRIGVDRMWFDLYFELDDVVEWTAHRAGVNEEGFANTPADAARAALAALSGDPTDG